MNMEITFRNASSDPPPKEGNYLGNVLPPNYEDMEQAKLDAWRKAFGTIAVWYDGNTWYGYLPQNQAQAKVHVVFWSEMPEVPPIPKEISGSSGSLVLSL